MKRRPLGCVYRLWDTVVAIAVCAVLLATPTLAEPGLSGLVPPPSPTVPARAGPVAQDAPYCTHDEAPGGPVNGLLMEHAWLVLRVCRDSVGVGEPGNVGPERMRVNDVRIPGLLFDHYPGQVKLTDFSDYEETIRCHRGPVCPRPGGYISTDTFARHERHGGALYEVWHRPAPTVLDLTTRPPTPLQGPSPYPFGNTYVFVPEPGTAALPPHHVWCHAEPKNRYEDEPVGCFVYVNYRGRLAFVQLRGAGPDYGLDSGYAEVHALFPHYARDIHTVMTAVDVTDDPAAQACTREGGDWRGGRCIEED